MTVRCSALGKRERVLVVNQSGRKDSRIERLYYRLAEILLDPLFPSNGSSPCEEFPNYRAGERGETQVDSCNFEENQVLEIFHTIFHDRTRINRVITRSSTRFYCNGASKSSSFLAGDRSRSCCMKESKTAHLSIERRKVDTQSCWQIQLRNNHLSVC